MRDACVGTLLALLTGLTAAAQVRVSIPFVGCRSDGQLGPRTAPSRPSKHLIVRDDAAHLLAYYMGKEGPGVLAPRGWFCYGTYGSNGSTVYVSPEPIDGRLLSSSEWKGFEGPVIQLSHTFGGTSGRFSVARVIARVFPAYQAFITAVQRGGFEASTTTFVQGPYPTDTLRYLNEHVLEFVTAPNSNGLGTDSSLLKSSLPISGVEILIGADTDLVSLSLRLPSEMAGLGSVMQHQVEREYTAPPSDSFQLP